MHEIKPTTDPTRLLEELDRLLIEQGEAAERLDSLSRSQSDAVARQDATAALAVMVQREPVVQRLVELSERAAPLVESLNATMLRDLAGGHPARRETLRRRIARIDELMAAIAERDAHDEATLVRDRDAVAKQLAQAAVGRDAVTAYGPGGGGTRQPGPTFQDREV